MRPRILVLALLLASACAQEPQPLPEPAIPPPGTPPANPPPAVMPDPIVPPVPAADRLAPRFVQAEIGGAWRFLHFVDRRLGEPCQISPDYTQADQVRCLPMGDGQLWYRDAACTQPVVSSSSDGEGRWVNATGFNGQFHVMRLGAPDSRPAPLYVDTGSRCHEYDPGAVYGRFHSVAEELPVEELATATLETGPLTRSLSAVRLRTPEGSRYRYDLIDPLTQERCDPKPTEAGDRCAPADNTIHDEGYRDLRCAGFAAAVYGSLPYAFVPELDQHYRFQRVPYEDSIGVLMPDGSCGVEGPERRGRRDYYLGTPYPPAAWPAIHIARQGGPRLIAPQLPLQEGEIADLGPHLRYRGALFEDTDRNSTCEPAFLDDAQRSSSELLRCVPTRDGTMSWGFVFADIDCTVPALGVYPPATPPRYSAIPSGNASPALGLLPVVQVVEVGGELGPREKFQILNDQCQRSNRPESEHYFVAGRAVAESELGTLRLLGGI
ncbi:MAG: hypothetical protein IT384_00905 [Deltaproteobacteria bacterium]|nr:hypothetical protein [Deltaproteobacteria bacterium]